MYLYKNKERTQLYRSCVTRCTRIALPQRPDTLLSFRYAVAVDRSDSMKFIWSTLPDRRSDPSWRMPTPTLFKSGLITLPTSPTWALRQLQARTHTHCASVKVATLFWPLVAYVTKWGGEASRKLIAISHVLPVLGPLCAIFKCV